MTRYPTGPDEFHPFDWSELRHLRRRLARLRRQQTVLRAVFIFLATALVTFWLVR